MSRPERGWSIRRADSFPSTGPGGNCALCCTTTCCCLVLVGAAVGTLAGGGVGLAFGIRLCIKIARDAVSRGAAMAIAGVGAFFGGQLAAVLVKDMFPLWPLVPFAAAGLTIAAASAEPKLAKVLGGIGAVVSGLFLGAAAGLLVLGGLGLALDFALGTFK